MNEIDNQTATIVAQSPAGSASAEPFRLILHVGAGKTGTSSIQETMRINQAKLQARGFWYAGLMLEYSPVIQFPWQIAGGFPVLTGLKPEEITAQLVQVLESSLAEIRSRGCHTAIISNEAIFHKIKPITDAVEILHGKGWRIEVVAYVRRHDSWVKSAYVQWGLKHKSYTGELQKFPVWRKRSPYRFSESLRAWKSLPGIGCVVRNADQAGDVVSDFMSFIGMPMEGLAVQQINIQPTAEELLLRTLYNKLSPTEVLPQEFDRVMGVKDIDFSVSATTLLGEYLPTEDDLKQHLEECSSDIDEVNRMLAESGQQPLDLSPKGSRSKEVDMGKVVAALAMMLVLQSKKLQHLQFMVNKLSQTVNR